MKKSNYLEKVICILLSVIMLFGIVGFEKTDSTKDDVRVLEPMEIEQVASYSLDAIGGSDIMPIAGFFAPYTPSYSYNGNQQPDMLTDEVFQAMKDCGVNYLTAGSVSYPKNKERIIKALELGEKYDIAILVDDTRVNSKGLDISEVDAYINEYANYSSFGGLYISDEPGSPDYHNRNGNNIDDNKHKAEYLNALDITAYHNMLPLYKGKEEAYEAYIQEFIDKFKPSYLQFDFYPFYQGHGNDISLMFSNISCVYKMAKSAKLPVWHIIGTGSEYNDARAFLPVQENLNSKGKFCWDISTRLAFGAKGIHYFTAVQPYWFAYAEGEEPFDFQRSGLISAWGTKTRWYFYAQEMNKQIAAIDHVLMNASHKGVIVSGDSAKKEVGTDNSALMKGDSWRELEKVTGDAIVGCFNYKGKTALYVVNHDREYAQKIRLDLIDNFEFTVIQNAKQKKITANNVELVFSPGNSALIVFE